MPCEHVLIGCSKCRQERDDARADNSLLSANLTACREDLAKYRAVTNEQAGELERLGAHASSLAADLAKWKEVAETLRKERDAQRSATDSPARIMAEQLASKDVTPSVVAGYEMIQAAVIALLCNADRKAARNYVEITLDGVLAPFDRAAVHLIRPGGKTPHEMRLIAETERDSALSDLAQVKARLEAFAPVDDLIDDWAWSQMDRYDLRDEDLATFVVTAMREAEKRLEALSTSQPAKETK